jgi:hypothetical protein
MVNYESNEELTIGYMQRPLKTDGKSTPAKKQRAKRKDVLTMEALENDFVKNRGSLCWRR